MCLKCNNIQDPLRGRLLKILQFEAAGLKFAAWEIQLATHGFIYNQNRRRDF